MIHILLACASGMSTSMVVKNMEKAARDKGIEAKIWAVPEVEVENEKDHVDVILLGPQVSFLEDEVKTMVNNKIPVAVIDMMDYGKMNGEAVLNQALELIGGGK
ncbi:PTS sugar transporter subunit IIB [Sporolactobacillus pectinivorans]|uniref:PTS sugar transporter subunit IIB n=1 Tax=Sporolactobacillus pectinivorans TaxID=1591408 RepID=UPI000C26BB9B|nr:PTS sugar transporter subunit IIB [Sporolactobacillus pectinivorans]